MYTQIGNPYAKLTRYHTMPRFYKLKIYSSENIVGKGEIACNFSFSQNVFYPKYHLFFILNAL